MKPDRVVTMTEARRRFEHLVDLAEQGEVILITRRRRPVGFLVSMALGRTIRSEAPDVPTGPAAG
jgi:prevent-host-death family protein